MAGQFAVGPAELRAVAEVLRGAADDLRSIRGTWDAGTRDGASYFGIAESAEAFGALHQELYERMGTHVTHIGGLGDASEAAAASYESTDNGHADVYGRRA